MHSDSTLTAAARGRARDIARIGPEAGRLVYIDGMRAIAIMAIIAFHARIPGLQGGFVGVDIFFVISGFLITTQIVEQTLAGRFSTKDFYARRILRILPPLLLVTCVTLAIAPLFPLLPRELRELAISAAATAAMASNYYFTSGTEYFAARSEIVPLLHTWSLGVEEQYYLLAPAIIGAVIAASARRKSRPVVALLIAGAAVIGGSYLVLAILTKTDHRLAFFSIMSRAWQFSLGGMLATAVIGGSTVPARFRTALGIAGFLAIIASVVLFDSHITYPGLAAGCLPTFGALFLLASGLGNERAPLMKILSSRPVVAIGVLSYGWYLWHWPLTAFARTLPFAHGSHWKDIAASSVALILSVPTYLFLEQPMKSLRRSDITRRFGGSIIIAGLAGSAVVAIVALVLARSPHFVGNVQGIDLAGAASQPLSGCRTSNAMADFVHVRPCIVGVAEEPNVVVWGDSHALMLAPVAEWAAQAAKGAAVILGKTSCPPLLGVEVDFFVARTCAASNDELLRWFQKQQGQAITGVMLGARWLLYSGHDTPAGDAELPRLLWRDSDRASSGYADILDRGLTDMLKAISPSHRVLIVGPVPELEHPPADCLMRAKLSGEPRESCLLDRRKVEQRNTEAITVLKRVAAAFPNARLIDPLDAFCDHDKCAPFGPQGIYYLDTDHLTPLGAELLYRHFEGDFLWVFGKAEGK
jgi:peptidoglycan/LPS O-acetylase OafA/YrhL